MWFDHAFIFVIHVCACVHTHTYTHIHMWSGPPRIMSLFSWTWQWRNQWCPNHSLFLHCEPNSQGQTFAPADIRLETGRTASTHNHPGGDSETCNIITSRWFTSQVGTLKHTSPLLHHHGQLIVKLKYTSKGGSGRTAFVLQTDVTKSVSPVAPEWCQERCIRAYMLPQWWEKCVRAYLLF